VANARETPLIGISAVSKVVGGLKVPLGHTEAMGFEIWEDLTRYEIENGFTGGVRKSTPQRVRGHCIIRLQDVDLANVADMKGLPSSALVGDLRAATPTKEVLSVYADQIGTQELELSIEGPGPEGPAEVKVYRAVVENPPRIVMGRERHQVLETQFLLLETAARKLYDIEHNL
jgi:hypothetical protein